jgi:drug/metabolite transporter (DMT)-like permease
MSTSLPSSPSRPAVDWTAIVAILVTVVGWASAFPAIRAGLTSFGPIELGALRFAIAAVPAGIFLLVTRPPLPQRSEIWRVLAGSIFTVTLYTALVNAGELTVSAGAASFIVNVNPVITAGFAVWLLGERFGPVAWVGTALSFGGIGLIALGESDAGASDLNLGALFLLAAALCASIGTIAQKPLFARHRALTVAAWTMVIGAICLAPALPRALEQAAGATPGALIATAFLGLVPGAIAYGAWAVVLSRLPASRASNILYCVPPVATLMGFLALGEEVTGAGILGGVLALAGVALVNRRGR